MTLSEKVLCALEEGTVSGEKLAKRFSVTRAAIWKAVNALRQKGYVIDGGNNRGYTLYGANISSAGVREKLNANVPVLFFPSLPSTSERAKAEPESCVVIALSQSAGRAKKQGAFPSAPGGIYFSVKRKGGIPSDTAVAGQDWILAVASLTGLFAQGNELFADGEKRGGVLVEYAMEFDEITEVVVGVGLYPNAYKGDANRLIAAIADKILQA